MARARKLVRRRLPGEPFATVEGETQPVTIRTLVRDGQTYVYLVNDSPWPVSVGSPQKAIKLLRRAVNIAPRPLTRVFLGEAYFEDEQYKRAIEQLERALEQRDALPPRWRKEAESYLKRAREEQGALRRRRRSRWALRTHSPARVGHAR